MATQTQASAPARARRRTPSIASHIATARTPAVDNATPAARNDAKDQTVLLRVVQSADITVANIVTSKEDDKLLLDLGNQFREASTEHKTLKDTLAAQKGGLAGIVFKIAQHAETRAKKPEYILAWFDALTARAEALEMEAQGVDKVADAMGTSWRTYKSQVRKALAMEGGAYLPSQFTQATEMIRLANPKRTRTARQPSAEQMEANDIAASVDPRVATALNALIQAVKASHLDDAVDIMGALSACTAAVAELAAERKADETETERKAA